MKNKQHHPKRRFPAFGMMESLISLVVIVIVTSLFSSTYLAVDTAKFESKNQSRAQQILSESVEAIRSIRDQSFLDLQNGTHGLHYEANLWNFTGSEDTVDDRFTRKVTIDPIYRNNTGDIDPEGTILDDRSKAIHVQVSWESDQEGSREIETQYSISDSYAFEGIDTTEQDWNNGTHNQTESTDTGDGALELERYQLCPEEVIAHWSFDDAYRPEWENRNRYQAVSVGAVWSDKAQRKGAMQFDGVDDYEDMGTNVDITGKELTITAWIKADKAESNPEIIAKSKGLDPGDTLWSLGLETGTSKQASLRFILKTDQGNSTKLVGGSITLGQWTQVAARYDGKTMKLSINGTEVARQSKSGILISDLTFPTWIGGNPGNKTSRAFAGNIDDVSLFQKALTEREIHDLFLLGLNQQSVCELTFDPWCGNEVFEKNEACDDGDRDEKGTCNPICTGLTYCGDGIVQETNGQGKDEECDDGNISNNDGCSSQCQKESRAVPVCGNGITENGEACDDGNTRSQDGCTSTCRTEITTCVDGLEHRWAGSDSVETNEDDEQETIIRDRVGKNDAILVGASWSKSGWTRGALKFDGKNDYAYLSPIDFNGHEMSISAWFKANELGKDPTIIAKSIGTKNDDIYWLVGLDTYNSYFARLRFQLKTKDGSTSELVGGWMIPYFWNHVLVRYDGNRMKIYLNGSEVGSLSKKGDIATEKNAPVWIGGTPTSATSHPFSGYIRDISLFYRALASDQVSSIASENALCSYQEKEARCGDGEVSGKEECDDGNTEDNDGCSSLCESEKITVCHHDNSRAEQSKTLKIGQSALESHLAHGDQIGACDRVEEIETHFFMRGDFTSAPLDSGSDKTIWNSLIWDGITESNSIVSFQIRTADTEENLQGATWIGPNTDEPGGARETSYLNHKNLLETSADATGTRWIQYRIELQDDGLYTPEIYSVSLQYFP